MEGPGASIYLAAEIGLHRFHRRHADDWRVRVEVIPKQPDRADVRPKLAPARNAPNLFQMQPTVRGRIDVVGRGVTIDLVGDDARGLACLLADLRISIGRSAVEQPEVARMYGVDGVAARDPRTGVTALRMKDVLRGRLDKFFEAWRD